MREPFDQPRCDGDGRIVRAFDPEDDLNGSGVVLRYEREQVVLKPALVPVQRFQDRNRRKLGQSRHLPPGEAPDQKRRCKEVEAADGR
jgi:hypothetical protein